MPSDHLLLSSFAAHGFVLPFFLSSVCTESQSLGKFSDILAAAAWSGVGGGLDYYVPLGVGAWLARRCGGGQGDWGPPESLLEDLQGNESSDLS